MWFAERASAIIGACMGGGVGLMGAALGIFAATCGLKEKNIKSCSWQPWDSLFQSGQFFWQLACMLFPLSSPITCGTPLH